MFNAEELIHPVSSDAPSGENLEYDPLYMELETLASSIPDSQMGDSTIEGRDPDWHKLQKNCLELWKKTRDLRVASYLTVAATGLDGLSGLKQGIDLLRGLVTEYWETLWPRLDPDDDNDPLERLNILAMLSPEPGAFNDPVMFISRLRTVKILPSLHYTLRDLMIANNELETGDETVDAKLIDAETMGLPVSVVQEQSDLVSAIQAGISALCAAMDEKMGGSYSLNMEALSAELKRLQRFYERHLSSEQPTVQIAEETTADSAQTTTIDTPAPRRSAAGQSAFDLASFKATSRPEALLLLKKSAEYFQREEPTSPVPFWINRAIRSAEMNFMDLLADIAPEALQRGKDILGIQTSENDNS